MKVYVYNPEGGRHAREGIAVEVEHYGKTVLVDTFWSADGVSGGIPGSHILTAAERAEAVFSFDTDDYDELDRHARATPELWASYAKDCRKVIPSQHSLKFRYFVCKGAEPDWATRVENAARELERTESEVSLAVSRRDRARQQLDAIRAERADELEAATS